MSENATTVLDTKLNVTKVEDVKLISGGAGEKFYTTYELKPGFYIGKNDAIFGGNGTNTKMVEAIPGEPAVKDKKGNIVIAEVPEIPAKPESSEVFIKCINQEVAEQMAARIQDMGFVINDMAAIFEAEGWFCFSFTAYAEIDDDPGQAKKNWREAIRIAKSNDEGSYNYDGLESFQAEKKAQQEAAKEAKKAERAEGVERRKEIRKLESEIKKVMKPIDKLEARIEKMTEQLAEMQLAAKEAVDALEAKLAPLKEAEEAANPKKEEPEAGEGNDDPDNIMGLVVGVNESGSFDKEDGEETLADEVEKMDEELGGVEPGSFEDDGSSESAGDFELNEPEAGEDDDPDDAWPEEFED